MKAFSKKHIAVRVCILLAFALAFTGLGTGLAYLMQDNSAIAETSDTNTTYSLVDLVSNYQNSIVQVIVSAETWNPINRTQSTAIAGYGSGTYFRATDNGGYILTNYHVVSVGDKYQILWYDGSKYDCTLVGHDEATDLAVLKFEGDIPDGVKILEFGDSDQLSVGEDIVVIGNPVADSNDAMALYGTVTTGIVSGLERSIDYSVSSNSASTRVRSVKLIQIDAPINSGVSGGALISMDGKLVGIPTLKYISAEGLGFCIAINSVKDYVDEIIENGSVSRARLGISIYSWSDGPDEAMKNYPPAGSFVVAVESGSGAEKGGIEVGDVITAVNGTRVNNSDELQDELDKYSAGDKITITVYRYYDSEGRTLDSYEDLYSGALSSYETFDLSVELMILD